MTDNRIPLCLASLEDIGKELYAREIPFVFLGFSNVHNKDSFDFDAGFSTPDQEDKLYHLISFVEDIKFQALLRLNEIRYEEDLDEEDI